MIRWKIQLLLGMTLIGQLSAQESSKKKEIQISKGSLANYSKKNSGVSPCIFEGDLVYEPEDKTKKISGMSLYDMLGNSLVEQKFSTKKPKSRYN